MMRLLHSTSSSMRSNSLVCQEVSLAASSLRFCLCSFYTRHVSLVPQDQNQRFLATSMTNLQFVLCSRSLVKVPASDPIGHLLPHSTTLQFSLRGHGPHLDLGLFDLGRVDEEIALLDLQKEDLENGAGKGTRNMRTDHFSSFWIYHLPLARHLCILGRTAPSAVYHVNRRREGSGRNSSRERMCDARDPACHGAIASASRVSMT
jgi:hypothetical protein